MVFTTFIILEKEQAHSAFTLPRCDIKRIDNTRERTSHKRQDMCLAAPANFLTSWSSHSIDTSEHSWRQYGKGLSFVLGAYDTHRTHLMMIHRSENDHRYPLTFGARGSWIAIMYRAYSSVVIYSHMLETSSFGRKHLLSIRLTDLFCNQQHRRGNPRLTD